MGEGGERVGETRSDSPRLLREERHTGDAPQALPQQVCDGASNTDGADP